MEKLANKEIIEGTFLFQDLSEKLLEKIDLFFSNTDLTKKQQTQLMGICREIYDEGYSDACTATYMNE